MLTGVQEDPGLLRWGQSHSTVGAAAPLRRFATRWSAASRQKVASLCRHRGIGASEEVIKTRERLLNLHGIRQFHGFSGGLGCIAGTNLFQGRDSSPFDPGAVRCERAGTPRGKPRRASRHAETRANRPLHRIPAQSPFFLRWRSTRARSSRVGVAIPDSCASCFRNSS